MKFPISNFQFSKGFTLIEILVALGIISLVFLLGLAAYREFNRRQQLIEAAKILRQDLQLAQQRASSGEKSVCTNPPANALLGYGLTFSTSSYSIFADCQTGSDPTVKSVNLPLGVTKTGGATSVTFKALSQGTTDTADSRVTLSHVSTGKMVTISVTRTGSISITFN